MQHKLSGDGGASHMWHDGAAAFPQGLSHICWECPTYCRSMVSKSMESIAYDQYACHGREWSNNCASMLQLWKLVRFDSNVTHQPLGKAEKKPMLHFDKDKLSQLIITWPSRSVNHHNRLVQLDGGRWLGRDRGVPWAFRWVLPAGWFIVVTIR